MEIVDNEVYVVYSVQAAITTKCPMDFISFPFDTQTCYLEIFSMDDQIIFKPVVITEIIPVVEFELEINSLLENISVTVSSSKGNSMQCKKLSLV